MQDFTNYTPNHQGSVSALAASSEAVFFQRIYTWMFAALAVTAGVAYVLSTSYTWLSFMLTGSRIPYWIMVFSPLGLCLYLNARLASMSSAAMKGFMFAFAALFGCMLSLLLVYYPTMAFVKAFVCTAGIYGAMAAYGLVTKRSLQGLGSFLYMGVWGLVLASVINMFTKSPMMDMVICVVGVLAFSGLTAYDHQKLRVIYYQSNRDSVGEEVVSKMVILGALTLYLDFINLFLFLLRLFGRGND